jgi:hypothetical protein
VPAPDEPTQTAAGFLSLTPFSHPQVRSAEWPMPFQQ